MSILKSEKLNDKRIFHFHSESNERLKVLYNISKRLSTSLNIKESFPDIIALAAECFPILKAVLIENENELGEATVWKSNASEVDIGSHLAPHTFVLKIPPYGELQLESSIPTSEEDLDFVQAIADLLSIALQRYYKVQHHSKVIAEKVVGLEEERELREDFVSLLTHDLRTPLSAALMSAQLILRKTSDPDVVQTLATRVISNLRRADEMITNLLDANLIRSGEQLPLKVMSFDMTELVKETIEDLTSLHGDSFIFKGDEKVEGRWDRKSIRRVIENLCSNAIKYGALNEHVILSLKKVGDYVQIAVTNKGEVIPPDDQKRLFNQFHRTQKAQGSCKKGWGIGLTLVQGVAEAHGGNVKVSSDTEKGTIFTVTLPLDARTVH